MVLKLSPTDPADSIRTPNAYEAQKKKKKEDKATRYLCKNHNMKIDIIFRENYKNHKIPHHEISSSLALLPFLHKSKLLSGATNRT
jgi:hypothetical protein